MTGTPTPAMIREAARWSAELATDEATEADRDACEAWCRQDPLHRVAMERMRGLDTRFDRAGEPERGALDRLLDLSRRRGGGTKAAAVLGIAVLVAAGWAATDSWTLRSRFPDAATVIGEQRTVTLADGSIRLDTDSAVDVDARGAGTRIALFRGRVFAQVHPHRTAPFLVETPEGTASALGTAFTVEREAGRTLVTVVSSHVRVCPARVGGCRDLAPGSRAVMDGGGVRAASPVAPRDAAAWSEGWLVADDRPVSEVLAELNRYRAVPVGFDAAALARVRVSGSFPLADTDRAVEGIARVTGLRLDREGEAVFVRR
ncbi:MAG TPA: FecR domain-containing protein [Novosphingobium sp.]|nr:FecR domain-containing protein [Novosphingobium sp.]